MHQLKVIDSHTGGEPTRVIVEGWPEIEGSSMAEKCDHLQDAWRRAAICEPRGNDVLVGALVQPSQVADFGVIFFNNVGPIGMCGHGMMGVFETLRFQGKVSPGTYKVETPVGRVTVRLLMDGEVEVENVPAFRKNFGVEVMTSKGRVRGDIAYGGNWFYICHAPERIQLRIENVEELTQFATEIRRNLMDPQVDHVELVGPAILAGANAKNFVLCPGLAYDRSPCGTGTSAKMTCMVLDRKLKLGEEWVQESITGSTFRGWVTQKDGEFIPTIVGRAFITAEASLYLDADDPFAWGIPCE